LLAVAGRRRIKFHRSEVRRAPTLGVAGEVKEAGAEEGMRLSGCVVALLYLFHLVKLPNRCVTEFPEQL
jgi:hypothetical protein